MPSIQSTYDRYPVTKNLARHMLRVAAIVQKIIENWNGPQLQKESMIRVALLHDTGNILKFDLDGHPELLAEEQSNIEHWKAEKEKWSVRFGQDENQMTYAIARECGLSEDEIAMMMNMGFGHIDELVTEPAYERKIIKYADMRVGPFGILPLAERLEEGRRRYENHPTIKIDENRTEKLNACARQIEEEIMRFCTIKPEEINDESLAESMEELKLYLIEIQYGQRPLS